MGASLLLKQLGATAALLSPPSLCRRVVLSDSSLKSPTLRATLDCCHSVTKQISGGGLAIKKRTPNAVCSLFQSHKRHRYFTLARTKVTHTGDAIGATQVADRGSKEQEGSNGRYIRTIASAGQSSCAPCRIAQCDGRHGESAMKSGIN